MRFMHLLFVVMTFPVTGQTLSHHVVLSGGSESTTSQLQLSWSIGEPIVEQFTGAGILLTQGFQQDETIYLDAGAIPLPLPASIDIFPNPASNRLAVVAPGMTNGIVRIVDVLGIERLSQRFDESVGSRPVYVGISELSPGIYIVHVHSDDGVHMNAAALYVVH